MNNEIWKDIKGYENMYQISNYGNVKSLNRAINGRWGKAFIKERILSKRKDKKGYNTVALYKNNVYKTKKIHRLVAEAFIPNLNNLPQVNHKDENKSNNYVDNLEWCNNKYNCSYGYHSNRLKKAINQYDLKGNLIKKWNSIKEASEYLKLNNTGIGDCCNHRKYRKTCGGYKWEFNNEINN